LNAPFPKHQTLTGPDCPIFGLGCPFGLRSLWRSILKQFSGNPFVPLRPLAFAHLIRRPRLWTRYSEFRFLRRYSAAFLRQVEELDMMTPDGTFGAVVTGMLDPTLLRAILGAMPEGTWELVCHPGYNDAELGGVRTRLRESRDVERRMMTSPETKVMLDGLGIELISYRDLQS